MIANFSVNGLVPMSAAIAGSEVAMTVESMFSMNKAVATMSGMRRCLSMGFWGGRAAGQLGLYHPTVMEAIAGAGGMPKCSVTCAFLPGRLGPETGPAGHKNLCMAAKPFDSAGGHARDQRQPH